VSLSTDKSLNAEGAGTAENIVLGALSVLGVPIRLPITGG